MRVFEAFITPIVVEKAVVEVKEEVVSIQGATPKVINASEGKVVAG